MLRIVELWNGDTFFKAIFAEGKLALFTVMLKKSENSSRMTYDTTITQATKTNIYIVTLKQIIDLSEVQDMHIVGLQ